MKAWIFIVSCVFLALSVAGQKNAVQLTVEPEEFGVNQAITITIKSNVDGDIVENWPTGFVKGYGIQSLSRYVQDVNTGKLVQEHIVVFTGSFNKSGKYKIGPFYVKHGSKTYTSNSVKVTVLDHPVASKAEDLSKQQLRQPAFGVIECSQTKIYEGEPLTVSARVYSKERTAGRPILKRTFDVENVPDSYPLQQLESWETLTLKGKSYESFAFDKRLIFPVGTGLLNFQSFEVYLPFRTSSFTVVSNLPQVEIVPLPNGAPAEFIGAVGDFKISQSYNKKKIKQGEIVEVSVIVNGTGNLHAIEAPILKLPKGMNTYGDPEVKEEYTFGVNGAEGKIIYTFHVQVSKEGLHHIPAVKIAYFNPKEGRYITESSGDNLEIEVIGDPNFKMDEDQLDADGNLIDKKDALKNKPTDKLMVTKDGLMWIGIGSAVLAASVIFLLFFKRRKEESQEVALVVENLSSSANEKNAVSATAISDVREQIGQAHHYVLMRDDDKFYATFEKAILLMMRYKLRLPNDGYISRSELMDGLSSKNDPSFAKLKELLEKCDLARYGMMDNEEGQENLLKELEACL